MRLLDPELTLHGLKNKAIELPLPSQLFFADVYLYNHVISKMQDFLNKRGEKRWKPHVTIFFQLGYKWHALWKLIHR